MAVYYNKLFKLLIDKEITNLELAEKTGFSANYYVVDLSMKAQISLK